MSREVDSRVVEMQFDGTNFEKNTKRTIGAIDRLMEKLQFKGAEKSFEQLDAAAAKVDFADMNGALETLEGHFSTLNIIGTTALVNITNKAVDAGTRLVKSLSLDQVMSGWNKYAQKTASVQTIMNATGKSITKVNSYLDKLMWYSDETSYSFTDMTASLGQLTAAGGNIDRLMPMIMGIANATAYAGKGASEFSRVIYNLNQSYSQGYLNLMDWKSVELAGVATAELKQQLIDTGVAMGKIKQGEVTVGGFASSLSSKWADKAVMETAFGRLAEFSDAVKKAVDAKQYKTAAAAIEALAGQYDEVTVRAFKAAQEAKSFGEAVDATKDAVSSGWLETFEIIFGNYEEAKKLWTDLANSMYDLFAGGKDARNDWLRSGLDSGLDQLLGTEGFGAAADNYTTLLEKTLMRAGVLSEEQIRNAGSFQKALEESGVSAELLQASIEDAADNYAALAALSDRELDAKGLDRDKIEPLAAAYADMAEKLRDGSVNLSDLAGKMNRLSGREHLFRGLLNILDGINSVLQPVRDAFSEVFMTDGTPLYNALAAFDELTGKLQLSEETAGRVQRIFEGIFHTLDIGLKGIRTAVKIAGTVIGKVLKVLRPVTDLLLEIGARIGDIAGWVNRSLESAGSLSDVVAILAAGLWALLEPLGEVWNGFWSFVRTGSVDTAGAQFGAFGKVVNALAGVLEKFKIGNISLKEVAGSAVTALGGVMIGVFDRIAAVVKTVLGGLGTAGSTLQDFAGEQIPLMEKLRNAVTSIPEKVGGAMKALGETLSGTMTNIAETCRNTLAAIREFCALNDVDIYRILALADVGLLALAIYGIAKAVNAMHSSVKKLLENPVTNFLNSLTSAVNNWNKAHTTNNLTTAAKSIAAAVALMSGAVYLLSRIEDPVKAATALASVISVLFATVIAMRTLAKADLSGLDTAKVLGTMVSLAIGLGALAASMKGIAAAMTVFAEFDTRAMNNAVGALLSIGFVLSAMVGAIGWINWTTNQLITSSKLAMKDPLKGVSAYLVIATALVEVCGALYLIAGLDESKLQDAYGAIFTLGLTMTGMIAALGALNRWNNELTASSGKKLRGITEGVSSFLVMATALAAMAGVVKLFADTENMWKGVGGAVASLGAMTAAMVAFAVVVKKGKKVKNAAKAMLITAGALAVFAAAVRAMSGAMAADSERQRFAGVTIAMILLAGALYVLSQRSMESMAAAAALVAMGAALIEVAVGMKMLAEMDIMSIIRSFGAMMSAAVVLAGGIAMLSACAAGIAPLAEACLMLATALLILTPAFKGLASLSLEQAAGGVVALAGLVGTLALIGHFPAISAGMTVLAGTLASLAKAFSTFAGGLIKFAAASAIFSVLLYFAGPICTAINEAGPEIKDALEMLVDIICGTIVDKADVIAQAIASLIIIVLDATIQTLEWLWDQLMKWFGEHPVSELFKESVTAGGMKLSELLPKETAEEWLNGIGGKAGAAFGEFILNTFGSLGEKFMEYEREAWGFKVVPKDAVDASKDQTAALEESRKAAEDQAIAVENSTKKTKDATTATNVSTQAQKAQSEGLIALTNEMGEVTYVTTDAANAMLHGANTAASGAAIAAGGVKAMNGSIVTIAKKETDVTNKVTEGVKNATDAATEAGKEGGDKIGGGILDGLINRLNSGWGSFSTTLQNNISSALNTVKSDIGKSTDWIPKNGNNPLDKLKGLLHPEDYVADVTKDPDDDKNNTPTGTGGKTKASGSETKKTVAETLAEEYTKKLKANKYLQDALDKETTLWNLRNEDAVSNEELLAKRSETVAKSIELQTQRVAIAQEQYDQLLSKAPTDDKTKDAYNTLLDEQANLEKLKQSRRDDIWKDLLTRYENDTKTAENEYELWSTVYGDSASVTEKANKQMEAINAKIKIQAQVLSAAEQDYTELKAEFGDESQRTQEAYRKYLEEQKSQQDLINELEQAQLDQFDNQIARWEKEYQLLQNRQKMLEKIYNDGDLAGQKDAYDSAVQKYGKDSKEARAAGIQGVMSSLVATGTAIADIGQSWKKLAEYQAKYDAIEDKSSDKALDAYAALQSEEYNLVGFAESLASAMDMGDTGKKAMMQLGYSIAKNWKSVQNGMNKVWDRLPENVKTGISKATNLAMTDGAAETISSTAQMIVAAMSGDYATATVAGLNTVLNFMNTEFGQKVLSGLADLFDKAGKTAQSSGLVTKLVGLVGQSGDKIAGLLGTVGGKIAEVTGSMGGEIAGLLGTVGTGIAEVAAAIGPEGLLIGAAVAGGAALIANWDKIDQWLEGVFDWLGNFFKKLWDGICGFFGGIIDGIKGLFGIHSPSRVMSDIGSNIVLGLEEGINDTADGAKDVALNCAQQVLDVFDEDGGTYEPRIRPVVDLTDAENGAAWMRANLTGGESAVALDVSRSASLADGVSRNAAAQKEAERRAAAEKDTTDPGNRDVVDAIGALGARIDGVAESVSRMKVCLNRRKVVGEILTDVDEGMGDRLM